MKKSILLMMCAAMLLSATACEDVDSNNALSEVTTTADTVTETTTATTEETTALPEETTTVTTTVTESTTTTTAESTTAAQTSTSADTTTTAQTSTSAAVTTNAQNTASADDALLKKYVGNWQMDGDEDTASIKILESGEFIAYYASGSVEASGIIKVEKEEHPDGSTTPIMNFYKENNELFISVYPSEDDVVNFFTIGQDSAPKYIREGSH